LDVWRDIPRAPTFQTLGVVRLGEKVDLMRADIEAIAADIEQSIGLLRRRL
jgi:hypothetical protein